MRRLQIGRWAALAALTVSLMGMGSIPALAEGTQAGVICPHYPVRDCKRQSDRHQWRDERNLVGPGLL